MRARTHTHTNFLFCFTQLTGQTDKNDDLTRHSSIYLQSQNSGEQKQTGLCEMEAGLVYTVSSRTPGICSETLSQKQRFKKKWSCRNDSVVNSTDCSSREHRFDFQHLLACAGARDLNSKQMYNANKISIHIKINLKYF